MCSSRRECFQCKWTLSSGWKQCHFKILVLHQMELNVATIRRGRGSATLRARALSCTMSALAIAPWMNTSWPKVNKELLSDFATFEGFLHGCCPGKIMARTSAQKINQNQYSLSRKKLGHTSTWSWSPLTLWPRFFREKNQLLQASIPNTQIDSRSSTAELERPCTLYYFFLSFLPTLSTGSRLWKFSGNVNTRSLGYHAKESMQ